MDFVRWGMNDAQPRFSDRGDQPLGGIMHPAYELDLNQHPDARLIAAAPEMLEALKAIFREPYGCPFCDSGILRNPQKGHEPDCPFELARLAISEAEG